jgi:metal-dependent amidase/aminoacylase/carboxypeptidase family protein
MNATSPQPQHRNFTATKRTQVFPYESVDPVIMAAEAVMELQTIRTRNRAPSDTAVVSVTLVHTGARQLNV